MQVGYDLLLSFYLLVLKRNKTEDFISVSVCRKRQPENLNGTKYLSIDEIRGISR